MGQVNEPWSTLDIGSLFCDPLGGGFLVGRVGFLQFLAMRGSDRRKIQAREVGAEGSLLREGLVLLTSGILTKNLY